MVRGWSGPLPPVEGGAGGGVRLRVVSRRFPGSGSPLLPPVRVLEASPSGAGFTDEGARAGSARRLPGWVVLHGITVLGLEHPSLLRFVGALAGSGAHVIVPELRAWTRLALEPEGARELVRGAVLTHARAPGVLPGGVGVAGFSFGGPQALLAGADPALDRSVRKVLAWGSYARLPSALRFSFLGGAQPPGGSAAPGAPTAPAGPAAPGGSTVRGGGDPLPPPPDAPDPYARWIAGANLLPLAVRLGEMEGGSGGWELDPRGAEALARALAHLAHRWGQEELDPGGQAFPAVRAALRTGLPPEARPAFDLFVPPQGEVPEAGAAHLMIHALAGAAAHHLPLLDPVPRLPRLHAAVHLIHGLQDDLIPWTESQALASLLRPHAPRVELTLTGLFAHSRDGGAPPAGNRVVESLRLAEGIRRVLAFE
jgi:hypothetical protein